MCDSCEVLYINGVKCHELGCPNAYQDEVRECSYCGQDFKPEDRQQSFCDWECWEACYA